MATPQTVPEYPYQGLLQGQEILGEDRYHALPVQQGQL